MSRETLFDAILALPGQANLDGLEPLLKAERERNPKGQHELTDAQLSEFSHLLASHPQVSSLKTSTGKNLAHLLSEYPCQYHMLEMLAEKVPTLFTEKESKQGFTPALYLATSDLATWIMELDDILSPKNVSILHDKDANGCGLAFWFGGHTSGGALPALQERGVDIFEKNASGLDILSAACLGYMQKALPEYDYSDRVGAAATQFMKKFRAEAATQGKTERAEQEQYAISKLGDIARENPGIYAPMLVILPADEAAQVLKTKRINCNTSQHSNPATHIAMMRGVYPFCANKELIGTLLDKEIMGEKAAKPEIVFGEDGLIHSMKFGLKTSQEYAANLLKEMHDAHHLTTDELQVNRCFGKFIKEVATIVKSAEAARKQGLKFVPSLPLSAIAVGIFLELGADVTLNHEGKTISDAAIAANSRDTAALIKTHIDGKLATQGMQAADRITMERERDKLGTFLSQGLKL